MNGTLDWDALASAALEEGRKQALEVLKEHENFISQFPKTSIRLATSTLPGRRREPEFWSSMLREMKPGERSAYRKMLRENAQKAAEWSQGWINAGSLFLDALESLGDVASNVILLLLKQVKDRLTIEDI